ncbi:hypothetical protein ACQEU6_18300 [Spirillospora sp. CA-108201]
MAWTLPVSCCRPRPPGGGRRTLLDDAPAPLIATGTGPASPASGDSGKTPGVPAGPGTPDLTLTWPCPRGRGR